VIVWNFLLFVFLLYRIFQAISFRKNPEKYTLEEWYIRFVFSALMTAVFFGALAFLVFYNHSEIEDQMFVIIILVGLSAGSSTAFTPDNRIEMGYVLIIMFSLLINSLLQNTKFHFIIAIMIIILLIAKIIMLIHSYRQEQKILEQEKQIEEVKKALEEKKNLLYHFVKEAPLAIFSYDLNLHIVDSNNALLKLLKTTKEQIIGLDLTTLPDLRVLDTMKKALHTGSEVYVGSYHSLKGVHLWAEIICFAFNDSQGNIVGGMGIINDKTNEKNIQEELMYMADHDVLTGLYNRRGFRNNMQDLILDKKHATHYSLLFYIDLNQFKGINDSLGHTIGDAVLISVSQRLKETLDKKCILNRLGGDEFLIVLPYVADDKSVANNIARKYAVTVESVFEEPFIIEEIQLHIQSSIGIIIIEPNYRNIEEIIRHADIAMYHAKRSHAHVSYYNESLDKKQKELFALQHALAYSIKQKQFTIYFQPIVTMKNEKLYAAESLIRWNHPQKGLLHPDFFIDLAIKAGLLSKITWWLIDEVCKQIATWKKEGLWKLEYISININPQQLIENNFAMVFLSILEKHGVETKEIVIEITERSLVDNFDMTQDVINILKGHGIRCAIDDFGVGYSSLSYLKKLSFHILKIDKEFVKEIEADSNKLALISTILNIGRQFDYTIIIEGIEKEKQKELLLSLDDDLLYQGYYFSKALPIDEFKDKYLMNKD